jgi:hypothetical protein
MYALLADDLRRGPVATADLAHDPGLS